jgi:hypothetical protein
MSEYQYYEFVAIDEPLTPTQMAELRSRSSRAAITATSFVNEYQWGDLKGDPVAWMRRYFDAHVYVANWCSCWLFLRVPKDVFEAGTLRSFETESALTVDGSETHWILEWAVNEGENCSRFNQEDGRGWMGRLAPLRDELLRGDLRPLYLGWLAGVSAGEVDDEGIEPPRPPGLSRLTAAQLSLAEFLEIDRDLLTAAGLTDEAKPGSHTDDDAAMAAWIADLPVAESREVLGLLLAGQAQSAERRLKARFLAWQRDRKSGGEPEKPRRTVAELREQANSAAETRKRHEAVQREKAEAERQARRVDYLRTLAADFDRCWQAADERAERGIASAYDEVKTVLVDLAEAYTLVAAHADFDRALAHFVGRHGKRGALVRRLVEAGLWKKP